MPQVPSDFLRQLTDMILVPPKPMDMSFTMVWLPNWRAAVLSTMPMWPMRPQDLAVRPLVRR